MGRVHSYSGYTLGISGETKMTDATEGHKTPLWEYILLALGAIGVAAVCVAITWLLRSLYELFLQGVIL